jgi:hypothetical protein
VKRAPGRDPLDGLDVRLEDPHVALGQAWRRTPALLELLFAHRRTRIDQHVADAELLDESQRLFPCAGADRHHADHRADAEHDAQRRQERPRRLRAEVRERLEQIRGDDHRSSAFITPAGCPLLRGRPY